MNQTRQYAIYFLPMIILLIFSALTSACSSETLEPNENLQDSYGAPTAIVKSPDDNPIVSTPTQYDLDALINGTPETEEDIRTYMSALFVSDGAYSEGIQSALIRTFFINPLPVVKALATFTSDEQTSITWHTTLYLYTDETGEEAKQFTKIAEALLEETDEQIYCDLLTDWITMISEFNQP
jgi:hypothetical protein